MALILLKISPSFDVDIYPMKKNSHLGSYGTMSVWPYQHVDLNQNPLSRFLSKIKTNDFGLYKEDVINELNRLQEIVDELRDQVGELTKDQ
jgi:hypothetical protein